MPYQNILHSRCFGLLLVFTLGLLFVGCSDDEAIISSTPSVGPRQSFLSSFYQSEELVYSFEYDGDKRLSRQVARFPEGNLVSEFEYNSVGKVSKMIGVRNGLILELNIFYNAEEQIDSIFSISDGSPWVINKFLYDDMRQLTRMMEYAPVTRTLVFNDYYWSDGDITRRETYFPQGAERLEERWVVEYKYDSLTNPFNVVYQDIGFHLIDREPISQHNWTSMRIFNKSTGRTFREIDKEYQYLGNGFPSRKRTYVYNGGDRSEDQEGVIADFFY
ncbi:MAG: hypothetical protein RIF33_02820 [Cyclobacteriaceae bacterium]